MAGLRDRDVVVMACSSLGSPKGSELTPFSAKQWASIRSRARVAKLSLGDLLGLDPSQLTARLALSGDDAGRLHRLLQRETQVAFELERLNRLGVWVTTLEDDDYPGSLRAKLGDTAPAVLFGAGAQELLSISGLAVVGSRDADPEAVAFADECGRQAARQQWSTVSGGARGIDQAAMRGAWEAGGVVVAAVAEGVERSLADASVRTTIRDEQAVFVSPYRPDASFSVGAAMGRNKLIYGLSTVAIVVSSAVNEGGTWAGAVEAMKHGWGPVRVRDAEGIPAGNQALLEAGATSISAGDLEDLAALYRPAARPTPKDRVAQARLFE